MSLYMKLTITQFKHQDHNITLMSLGNQVVFPTQQCQHMFLFLKLNYNPMSNQTKILLHFLMKHYHPKNVYKTINIIIHVHDIEMVDIATKYKNTSQWELLIFIFFHANMFI